MTASTLTTTTRQLGAALRLLLVFTVLLGVVYPLAITGVAQVIAPGNANGSRIEGPAGRAVGSDLVGQRFDGPGWFHPRPSAAGEDGYDTLASAASNLGPNSTVLADGVRERRAAYAAENGVAPALVPVDALTASASGLDPHVSPANAQLQAARVARARRLPLARVRQLVDDATQGRTLGILGDPRVNVVRLNLALEALRR